MIPPPPSSTLFPYTTLFRSLLLYLTPRRIGSAAAPRAIGYQVAAGMIGGACLPAAVGLLMQSFGVAILGPCLDRKSTRLNSSHTVISYAVFCLKKKKKSSIL